MRAVPRRPRRRRHPRRAARRARASPPPAALVRRPQREQARRDDRPRGRPRAPAGAARDGGRVDRDDAARHARRARARTRRRARAQPAARDHVDHRLRPDRRLPRVAGQRPGPCGDERHPQPLRTRRARPAPAAGRHGVRDDRDPGGVGDARRLLEPPGDRPRGSRRLLGPRGRDADHGPGLRHRLRESRVRLPVDPRAAGGRALPDLPVRRRPRPRRRAGAAPVAGDARLARRARGLPGRALRRDPGAARGVGRAPRALRGAVRRHDEGRDRGRGPGARRAGRAGPQRAGRARQRPLRGARRVRRRRDRARRAAAGCRAASSR